MSNDPIYGDREGVRELPRFPDAPTLGDRSKKRGRHRTRASMYQMESLQGLATQRVTEANG